MLQRKLSDQDMLDLYFSNVKIKKVAEIDGASKGIIYDRLHGLGIKLREKLPEKKVADYYKRVESIRKTAEHFNTSHKSVLDLLDRLDIPRTGRNKIKGYEEKKEKILSLYPKYSVKKLADKLDISCMSVYKMLKEEDHKAGKYNNFHKEEVIDLYVNYGLSKTRISEEYGVSRYIVNKALKREKIPIRSVKIPLEERENIKMLKRSGKTTYEIADKYNVTHQNISRILKAENFDIRRT